MTTPIEDGSVQGDISPAGENAPGPNPAWDDVLSVLPEQFHPVVTPHFQKWDQSAQQRVEQANQSVAQFEPYKPFVENGISPEDLEQGLQLMYQINQDPKAVYEALGQAYGLTSAQVEAVIEGEGEEGEPQNFQDPRFDQIQNGLDLVAQTLLQQEQAKISAQADAELDSELTSLREKFPNFDEHYVLSLVANGATMEQAAQQYEALTQNILQQNPRPFAPNVMGNSSGGTGLPSQAIDPKTLDGAGRRALVAQMLKGID